MISANHPLARLRHHVSDAIARGEGIAIVAIEAQPARMRFTVEPNGKTGFYVADNRLGEMVAGPFPSRAQAAYECDRARMPLHHDGSARRAWHDLCDVARRSWERDPEPREWKGIAA